MARRISSWPSRRYGLYVPLGDNSGKLAKNFANFNFLKKHQFEIKNILVKSWTCFAFL
jgi:hypothetical protein